MASSVLFMIHYDRYFTTDKKVFFSTKIDTRIYARILQSGLARRNENLAKTSPRESLTQLFVSL